MTLNDSTLIDERAAARILGVSVPTTRRWRGLGTGPTYYKLNGAVRYALTDLQKFINDRARLETGSAA